MLGWLKRLFGVGGAKAPAAPPAPPRRFASRGPSSRFDNAATTADNARHWGAADGLSARAVMSPDVRQRLRNRARYERANNSYCQGLVLTLVNDLVGAGPKLRCRLDDEATNRAVQDAYGRWAKAAGVAEKRRVMAGCKLTDGEAFAVLTTNLRQADPVKLSLRLVEAEQVQTPLPRTTATMDAAEVLDGIELDAGGNPAFYHVLRHHPGDTGFAALAFQSDRVPADRVIHWFRRDRPGQTRGVPEITPALGTFANLRRLTEATLAAAETAADISAVLLSKAPAPGDDEQDYGVPPVEAATPNPGVPFDAIPIEKRTMVQLPDGMDMKQFAAEHPNAMYQEFKRELLKECGRCVNAPFNVVGGDSSQYNYSSARLDHLLYRSAVRVVRSECEEVVEDRLFDAWLEEARLVPGYLPDGLPDTIPHDWFWGGFESIDPLKEAAADTEALANGTMTLQERYAEAGQDWESHVRQRGKEVALLRDLGLMPIDPAQAPSGQGGKRLGTEEQGPPPAPPAPPQPSRNGRRQSNLLPLTEFLLRAEVTDGR
jgi:lambda family phage portal protein